MSDEEKDFGRVKHHSIKEIEKTISDALSELFGRKYDVDIRSLTSESENTTRDSYEINMKVKKYIDTSRLFSFNEE